MQNKKIKICFVTSVDITLKFILLSQMRFFAENGYEVYAVCSAGKWVKSIEDQGIRVKVIKIKRKISPLSDIVSLFNLALYFKKEKFDIVCTHTPKAGLLGQLGAKMAGAPVVCNTIFGFYFNETTPFLKRKFFIAIEKIAGMCSDIIFFRNREDFETAKKEGIGYEPSKIYIGDGIDVLRFDRKKFSAEFIENKKNELGIQREKIVVGIVARMVKEKGYLELFSAFKKVIEKFPNAVLVIAGGLEPDKKDKINLSDIKKYGIEKNVLYLGERTDVDELYAIMDIFVLPSWREGFPHSVMEASAMSLPVVATNIRGCRDAVENGKTGILVPSKNYQELYGAICSLISDLSMAGEMGKRGRQKAENEFNESVFFDKMDNNLKKAVKIR